MKLAVTVALAALALAAAPSAAQTHVSVSIGVHAPPVSGRVVIRSGPRVYRERVVVVSRRPHRGPRGLVIVGPPGHARAHGHGHGRGHHHHHHHRHVHRLY